MVSEEMEMSERLLRAIYRPQNYYCVHVTMQSEALYKAYESISSCLPNVILPIRRVFVEWDRFSALDAELSCLETLWPFTRWKYFINLNEKEFPLKSNAELVQILQSLDGANDVHASRNGEHAEKWPFDHDIHYWHRPFRGSPHMAASRAFVDYALHHTEAESILEWVKALKSHHHEIFFSTLNHNPNIEAPGSHIAVEESDYYTKPHISQYRVTNTSVDQACKSGRWDNADCVLSFGDLPEMLRSKKLFASTFHIREDPLVVSCLEERLYNETKSNFIDAESVNVSYYRNLNFVLSHVRV
ncbi:unnamed protein product [Lymnaea stagnalis]|uniref:Protein xylosyltransferase n=1 Tax=Lymnaea stagnalis TaxID=6523 RepID=A0AAV2HDD2_LYMST